ncbi:MAG: type VI secretion protein IcmF/TssM N-terminal domain-containing protein [Janthinobacterium lividum]
MNQDILLLLSVLITLMVAVALAATLYFAARGAAQGTVRNAAHDARQAPMVRWRQDSLRLAFRRATRVIEANIVSRSERYRVPWVLVLNESSRDEPLPVGVAGVAGGVQDADAALAPVQGVEWQFFDGGVVVDLRAAFLGLSDARGDALGAAEKPWEEFLRLCHGYRPQRPFDALVITVPASLLLDLSAEARLELTQRATRAHRRIWLAQNRFAMRFATYLVVTDCERVAGFPAFARHVPEDLRGSMLGWSSPFDPSINYQAEWVDTALAGILQTVSDTTAELFALGSCREDAAALLTLPARLDAMREPMQSFVDELMRPSAYHEPFLLRGIYLSGDDAESFASAPAAAGRDRLRPAPASKPARRDRLHDESDESDGIDGIDGIDESDRDDPIDPATPDESAWADVASASSGAQSDAALLGGPRVPRPVFLRDLFERKIFVEYGLTQPSRTQRLRRPLSRRAVRWGAVVLLGGWSVALVFATRDNVERSHEWAKALAQFQRDDLTQRTAVKAGLTLDPGWYRARLLALLRMNATLGPSLATTLSMPGSWGVFDRLEARLSERLQRVFESVAAPALHRELMTRVVQLTRAGSGTSGGANADPGAAGILRGGECRAPRLPPGAAVSSASLAVAAQPEMLALQSYVAELDQLAQAFAALRRLQGKTSAAVEDLHFLIRYAFGVDLHNDLSHNLAFFHGGANSANLVGDVETPAVRQALLCTFNKGEERLAERLFENNPLYEADRRLSDGLRALRAGDAATLTESYRQIFDAIETERHLVSTGAGAWMLENGPGFGATYEALLVGVARNPLLGQAAADRLRDDMDFALQAARSAFSEYFADNDSAIAWDEKRGKLVLSPARIALRDTLAQLLDPMLLAPRNARALPAPRRGEVLVWNSGQLDHALALRDTRKRFLDGALAQLPPTIGDSLGAGVDTQFSTLIDDRTTAAAGMIAAAVNTDPAAFLAAGTRLQQIAAALDEWNANELAAALRQRVSADAIEHLRAVDAALAESDLYGLADPHPTFARSGENPLAQALGIRDPAAVGAYVRQQAARALALGERAAVYLPFVAPEDANLAVVRRWATIDRDLTRYKLSNPNSALFALEQWVVALGAAQAGERCADKLPRLPALSGVDDYFAGIHQRLYQQLARRCQVWQDDAARRKWVSFATVFDRDLAGQSPFASPNDPPYDTATGTATGTATDLSRGAADYRQVADAIKQFDELSHVLGIQADGRLSPSGGGRDVDRFLARFAGVARVLAPLYPGSDDVPAGYDVNVDFRVNQREERYGNQIIDWSLQSGAQTVNAGSAPRTLRWQPGMPVVLTLRLAKNAPDSAIDDASQADYATDGRTVSFRFSDPWALLTFIARHHVPQADAADARRTIVLKFSFPLTGAAAAAPASSAASRTASSAARAARPAQAQATVFIRLVLAPAGKKSSLPWPGLFPTRSAEWKN